MVTPGPGVRVKNFQVCLSVLQGNLLPVVQGAATRGQCCSAAWSPAPPRLACPVFGGTFRGVICSTDPGPFREEQQECEGLELQATTDMKQRNTAGRRCCSVTQHARNTTGLWRRQGNEDDGRSRAGSSCSLHLLTSSLNFRTSLQAQTLETTWLCCLATAGQVPGLLYLCCGTDL